MAEQPGTLFVVATFVPLASFALLLIAFALRAGLRKSNEDTLGRRVYELLGGDSPPKWPAYVATGAIGVAFVFCLVGFVWYLSDHAKISGLEESVSEEKSAQAAHQAEEKGLREQREALRQAPPGETAEQKQRRQAALAKVEQIYAVAFDVVRQDADRLKELRDEIHSVEGHWKGQITWARLGDSREGRQSTILSLGYKIDGLNAVMFVMVSLIATLIHVYSIGYMSDELNKQVEDHQVHTAEGHLHRRGRFGRFFLFLSLFSFSMLNLILADNLFQVFISWELVGICSYLLIGFYYERTSAANAANKAFITNRIGDAGFIIGLLILWTFVGTFNFDEIFNRVRTPAEDAHHDPMPSAGKIVRGNLAAAGSTFVHSPDGGAVLIWPRDAHLHGHDMALMAPDETNPGLFNPLTVEDVKENPAKDEFGSMPYWMLVVAGLGIFMGCVGKSAQFPLHVWLPDAMEGPTPVSALIHAATMVAAGVYLVGRVFPIFTSEALLVIAYTGGITLLIAASIAVVMNDIKKVLAYSTVSQLGYMMLGLGIGGWVAGLFHLVTHAFFKALLFLGSGSVIFGCHHEQDMGKMGGLYPKMKITALTMLMGVLAIAGIPAFSGWYSKDAILASAMGFVMVHPEHVLLFLLPLATAGLTAFYMFRLWFMTFCGKPRDQHVYDHAHESPRVMTTPLIVLAVFSVIVAWGWPFFSTGFPFVNAESSWLEHTLHHAQPLSVQADFGVTAADVDAGMGYHGAAGKAADVSERVQAAEFHSVAGNLALVAVIIGIAFAVLLYYQGTMDPAEAKAQFPGVHRFLSAKWYFDELYSVILVRPAMVVSRWCRVIDMNAIDRFIDSLAVGAVKVARFDGRFDNRVIDGLANLIATVAYGIGGWFRRWQTGFLRSYVLFLVLAVVGIFVLVSALMAG